MTKQIAVKIPGREVGLLLSPGDVIDFGEDGLLAFFDGDEARAVRLLQEVRARAVRSAVEFAKAQASADAPTAVVDGAS